ncbi:bifunctional 3-(3-hydroxy-phenyl)propionate/3-hydroxycinnamic acid hydroxylase [Williamsia sp.]|uniref:bifunctional 3-(3-hydroxy-phenyl)propionate/3-hydroxycinnamic acid hydroxylase n=1 Tax=Williamsia sp. TaxID=1872085 RepID=UPI002F92DB48
MSPPVIIVGSGPTGLTAACLLARYGVESVVLDRRRGVYPLPRAVHLDDEVYRIVQSAGAAIDFGPSGRPASGMRLVDDRHRLLMRFPRDNPAGYSGWRESTMFDQPDLERALRAAAYRLPGITFREGCAAERVVIEPDGTAGVHVRSDEGIEEVVRARYVLGCDGTSSVVGAEIGGGDIDLRFNQRWLVVDVRSSADLQMWSGVHQVCAGAQAATFMRIGADRYRWEFRLSDHEDRGGDDESPDHGWATAAIRAQVPDADFEIVRTAIYRHGARVARRWRRGPLFVLGDAAHVTPPFIGQGLGAGQRDAMNLVWKLAAVLDGDADGLLLDTYQAERRPHVLRAVAAATAIGRLMSVRAPARGVVDVVMRGLDRAPGSSQVGPRLIYPPLGRSAMRLRDRIEPGGRWVGRLFPQFIRSGPDGSFEGTDEVLGIGYALVHIGPVNSALSDMMPGARSAVPADFGSASHLVRSWLEERGANAVLVRPDRLVCGVESVGGRVHAGPHAERTDVRLHHR